MKYATAIGIITRWDTTCPYCYEEMENVITDDYWGNCDDYQITCTNEDCGEVFKN